MSTFITNDYDLCLIRRSEQDTDVYAAAVLGCHSAIEIGGGEVISDAYDVFTDEPVTVAYLKEVGVTLLSESGPADVAVTEAIQGLPTNSFRVLTSTGKALGVPTVISRQRKWCQRHCVVRFEGNLVENADVRALIRHAQSFELALGGLPTGIPIPRHRVESIANQYRCAATRIDVDVGFVIPFNNLDGGRGFLLLKRPIGNNVYECDCFLTGKLAEGAKLDRIVTYCDRVSNDELIFQSTVGEVVALD